MGVIKGGRRGVAMIGTKDSEIWEGRECTWCVFDNEARTAYVGRLDPAIWGRIWIRVLCGCRGLLALLDSNVCIGNKDTDVDVVQGTAHGASLYCWRD